MKTLVRFACAGLILLTMGMAGTAWGQAYPTKPIRLILGLPPGGMNDIVARIVSEQLTASLGQPVIVDNRVGASGTIGASIAAKSPPDGYTIFMGSVSNIGIAPSQFKDLPYDPVKDFEPITRAASAVCVSVVNPNFPVKSTRDLIAMAKQKPGALTYASAGQGSSTHLTAELFNSQAGIQLVNVPYKGDAPGCRGRHGRPCPRDVSHTAGSPAIYQGRQVAPDRGLEYRPLDAASRCAYRRRIRCTRLRGGRLGGILRPGRHT